MHRPCWIRPPGPVSAPSSQAGILGGNRDTVQRWGLWEGGTLELEPRGGVEWVGPHSRIHPPPTSIYFGPRGISRLERPRGTTSICNSEGRPKLNKTLVLDPAAGSAPMVPASRKG